MPTKARSTLLKGHTGAGTAGGTGVGALRGAGGDSAMPGSRSSHPVLTGAEVSLAPPAFLL